MRSREKSANRRTRLGFAVLAVLGVVGCGGYEPSDTSSSVTLLSKWQFPATEFVALHFRPPMEADHCLPLALIEVEGDPGIDTATVLDALQERAMALGATALYSVAPSRVAQGRGRRAYSAHFVSGLAMRCLKKKPPGEEAPVADAYTTGSSMTTE